MLARLVLFLFLIFLLGCKSSYIHEGKVIPHDDYKHYYVLQEQGTDKDIGEKVETVKNKVTGVFKKKPVDKQEPEKPSTRQSVSTDQLNRSKIKRVSIPKRRVREVQSSVTRLPDPVEDKLMPMTPKQVEIIDLKNDFVTYLSYIQAIIILILLIFIIVKLQKKSSVSKKNKNKDTGKVLNHDK